MGKKMTRTKQRWTLVAFALSLIAAMVTMVGVSSASAHTPSGGATCDGYFVKAVSYESKDTNTIESKFDGVETKRNFATSDQITGSWPQDGIAHTWSGYVHTTNSNQGYSKNYGPITLTCGSLPKDADYAVATTPGTCDTQGSATVTKLVNATAPALDQTVGTHNSTATSIQNHRFSNNGTTKTVTYTIEPKDVSQHCFVQPPDEHQYKNHSTKPNCKDRFITTTYEQRDRSYYWDGTAYVPGAWSAWYVTSTSTVKVVVKHCVINRHANTRVTVVDKCNCFMDKVTLHHGSNVRVHETHPTKLTWIFKVTGKTVKLDNGKSIQYLLPSKINGSHGWAKTQTYKVHTTNVACPCHKTHTCHHATQPHPPHCPTPGRLNGKPCHV